MTETMANEYSSDRTQRGLSNKYHHDRVRMIFIIVLLVCALDYVTSATEGLSTS